MVAAKYLKNLLGTSLQRTSQIFLRFVFERAHGCLAYQNEVLNYIQVQFSLVYAKCL